MTLPAFHSVRFTDTHRLLPAKYSPDLSSVLTRIANNTEHLQAIFALDDATNDRLLAEQSGTPGIDARELVFLVPESHIINAAFTHPNPLGARFSTPQRGAWYASCELATSKAEVLFHKSVEYAEVNWHERETVQYDDYLADFSGEFHDLRGEDGENFAECLSPRSYVASQKLARQLLDAGSIGVVYPSVRRPAGTCVACFRPSVVSYVRKSHRYKLTWTPNSGGRLVRAAAGALFPEEEDEESGARRGPARVTPPKKAANE